MTHLLHSAAFLWPMGVWSFGTLCYWTAMLFSVGFPDNVHPPKTIGELLVWLCPLTLIFYGLLGIMFVIVNILALPLRLPTPPNPREAEPRGMAWDESAERLARVRGTRAGQIEKWRSLS